MLGEQLESRVAQRFDSASPALSHALLASLRCHEAVTTNYDRCSETAMAAVGEDVAVSVMPWEKPTPGRPWLLKLHGDARRPDSVVLTRGQFIAYDGRWRPVGSVFQSLLMTRELLVVGASLSDDNDLRLAHEVRALRRRHHIEDTLGTVLALGSPRCGLDSGRASSRGSASGVVPARRRPAAVEIFLDAVATHAFPVAPYLLHPHYADLLDDLERDLAQRARDLATDIRTAADTESLRNDTGWAELLAALESLGAEAGG